MKMANFNVSVAENGYVVDINLVGGNEGAEFERHIATTDAKLVKLLKSALNLNKGEGNNAN